MTLSEFMVNLEGRIKTLLDINDTRAKPWGRREFILYAQGALETFFFLNGNPDKADVDACICNVVIDSGVLDMLSERG